MNNDAILASISKIHAYRYAKEKQRGVLTADGGFSTKDKALLQVPCTIKCVFIPRIFEGYTQTIFTTTPGSVSPRIDITTTSKLQIFVGIKSDVIPVDLDKLYNIVFVVDTNIQSVYVNGELLKNVEFSISSLAEYSIGSKNNHSDRFQGDYLLHQHFNYAMSADEVKALDNNGDPMGYVVPKAKRGGLLAEYLPQNLVATKKGPQIEPLAESFEMNMGDVNYKRVIAIDYPPYSSIYRVDYIVDEWNYDPAPIDVVGFGFFKAKYLSGTYKWQTLEAAKIGEVQSFIFSAPSGDRPEVGLYAALNEEGAITRHLKVTIKSITPVSAATIWLDSAKQLPWSDAHLPPLLQSKGGYDMVANGSPKVLFNE